MAKRDPKPVLRTGYIGPCVAFYGVNPDKGIAFMSHIDGNIVGLQEMSKQLDKASNKDLKGFFLFATSNYSWPLRLAILLLPVLGHFIGLISAAEAAVLIGISALYLFWSLALVYLYALCVFKTARVKTRIPLLCAGRLEVEVDASKAEPSRPIKDSLSKADSKDLYETLQFRWPLQFWSSGQRDSRPPKHQATP